MNFPICLDNDRSSRIDLWEYIIDKEFNRFCDIHERIHALIYQSEKWGLVIFLIYLRTYLFFWFRDRIIPYLTKKTPSPQPPAPAPPSPRPPFYCYISRILNRLPVVFRWTFHQNDDEKTNVLSYQAKVHSINILGVVGGPAKECIKCGEGSQVSADGTSCEKCGVGTYSKDGIKCISCKDGYFTDKVGFVPYFTFFWLSLVFFTWFIVHEMELYIH